MKLSKVSKWVGASVLSLSLATLPVTLSASAQTNVDPATGGTGTTTTNVEGYEDNNFDWGWLGLLGLIGLAGLMRKPTETVRYRDADNVTPGTRAGYRE